MPELSTIGCWVLSIVQMSAYFLGRHLGFSLFPGTKLLPMPVEMVLQALAAIKLSPEVDEEFSSWRRMFVFNVSFGVWITWILDELVCLKAD